MKIDLLENCVARRAACVLAASFVSTQSLACEGDVSGAWQRATLTSDVFETIQTFRIDTASGALSVCGSDQSWDSEYSVDENGMRFGFARRMRHLSVQPDGTFSTEIWEAEHRGQRYRYRVIAVR